MTLTKYITDHCKHGISRIPDVERDVEPRSRRSAVPVPIRGDEVSVNWPMHFSTIKTLYENNHRALCMTYSKIKHISKSRHTQNVQRASSTKARSPMHIVTKTSYIVFCTVVAF